MKLVFMDILLIDGVIALELLHIVNAVYIAIARLVCFVKNDDKKKGEIVFTILPLISILDSLVYGFFSL